MGIERLGYVVVETDEIDSWHTVARDILSASVEETQENGARALRIRIDERPFRILVVEGETPGFGLAGWEVADAAALDALREAIVADGLTVDDASEADRAARDVAGLFRFRDPEGYLNEVFHGARETAFTPDAGHSGYVLGELGLGHVMYHCARYPQMVEFYRDVMGFRLSDKIVWADADASFMRCNARHHSLALINEALGMKSGDTNHLMFEMRAMEDVVAAYEKVLAAGFPIIMTLGRHSNCKTISFYFVGPSGFGIEIGYDSHLVDESDWEITTYDTTKIWGHLLPHERKEEYI